MARPKNADPEETQARILEAAIAELAEGGPISFSARSVARRAGVGVATVHHYYVDRQGLLDACINRMYGQLGALAMRCRDALRATSPLDDRIALAVREGYRFGRAHRVTVQALQVQVFASGELDAARRRSTQLPFLASLGATLSKETGIPELAVRVRIQSVLFAVSRWVVATDDDMRELTGIADVDRAVAAVEDELVELATKLLSPRAVRSR